MRVSRRQSVSYSGVIVASCVMNSVMSSSVLGVLGMMIDLRLSLSGNGLI